MAVPASLGITQNRPYIGYSTYISSAYTTENPKYAPKFGGMFPRIRIMSGLEAGDTYPSNQVQSNHIWASALRAAYPNLYILYGGAYGIDGPGFNPQTYAPYLAFIQNEASWAQSNNMDAFCIGNEMEIVFNHITNAMSVQSLTRSSNVVTATFGSDHSLTSGDYIFVSGANESTFNIADSQSAETVQVTVVDSTHVTYPATGTDGGATGTLKMNWSYLEVIRKVKTIAAACQTLFTRGPIIYSVADGYQTSWITAGRGTDIDLLGFNVYGSGNNEANYIAWKTVTDAAFAAFSTNMIITELNCVGDSGSSKVYNFNYTNKGFEYVHPKEIMRRFNYLVALGITQIYYYSTAEGAAFYNTWPNTEASNAYIVGDFKPVVSFLRGERKRTAFFGTGAV